MEEVFASLDTNMTLLERLDDSSQQDPTRIREPPEFLCALHQQYDSILHELDAFQVVGNQLLSDRVLHRQLCLKSSDHDDGEPSSISACPWRYQRENLIFLQRHERRHRPLAIKRQDRGTSESVVTRDTLASTFSPQLAGYQELQWYLASATLAANESDDNESDDEDDKADQKARSETEVVAVMSYRRRQAPSDAVTAVESLIAAHQELLLSPYFQQYLGCHEAAERDDPNEERTEQLYCFEFAPTLTLEQLLRIHGGFHEKSKAFRFFAREILLAIVDLQEQSTHTLHARLTPSNVLISYSGRRVLLGRLEFGESIDFFKTDITIVRCRRENERLADLALLLFALRYGLTLPLNLSAFRSQYLACHDPQFVFEFALARTSQPCSIHVGVGSTFTLLLQEDDQAEWELVSVERLELVAEDMASMMSAHVTPPPAPVAPASSSHVATATDGVGQASSSATATLDEIFLADGHVNMRLLMLSLWKYRKDEEFTRELCRRLGKLSLSTTTLDQAEFYLPQLAHMVIHLDKELPIEDMEQFVLLLSQSSVHFALQLFWIVYAALDEHRPKLNGNPRTFSRCTKLLLVLEQCLVYGSPVAREANELLLRNNISKAEMEQIMLADRRFFAAQSAMDKGDVALDASVAANTGGPAEGWLYKKGGGTSKMGRRNWKLRWCRIERRMLLVFSRPTDTFPRTAVALDRAELHVVQNPKHPFYFELEHEFSETKMKFAAQSQEDLVNWIQRLHRAACAPEPPVAASPRSTSPTKTIARMSWAMRSLVLDSANAPVDGETSPDNSPMKADAIAAATTTTSVGSPSKSASALVSPPQSPKCRNLSSPFGTSDAWSESLRRARTVSSVSAVSGHSTSSERSMAVSDSDFEFQPSLPYDQQRRYEFFTGMITFVKAITDISEALRRVEPPKRKASLRPHLELLHIPQNAYIPLCKSTDPYCRVVSIFASEGRVFSTHERAPCLLYFDTEENEQGRDVSHALFDLFFSGEDSDSAANDPVPTQSKVPVNTNAIPSDASPFLRSLLSSSERNKRLEKTFGELSYSTSARLREFSLSPHPNRWRLCSLIAKSHDDLRQEVLVMQLISFFDHIFRLEQLPLRLRPYRILSTGASTGLLEVVRDAISLDGIKKTPDFKNLRHLFEDLYGGTVDGEEAGAGDELLRQAELNFIYSLAAYSIVCYILSIKDRHNGNILLDVEGHLVHIDFGFFLGRAPGGSFSFETAPFKLTTEMVDVLGGRQSTQFKYFSGLCVKGALAARKHAETIYSLVEVMSFHSKLPCFLTNTAAALAALRERLFLNMPEERVEPTILSMIERAYDHFGTNKYDQFQVYTNGIAK
ncbi:hypothetical protein Poli38472_013933 [Pythium oligandrum]|uniref:1-phosphatidylinositol 4-kinase n=1 Tax=Pythium oligandrum TaxID=41045 RepID=A0A8K1FAL0_PYTOL|nr:hypothetical protein Poli38472_013933 [Pythium oligandrum]|eukprot:TMW55171.1 hypothetical protein Poli38472_013933 [Pythium oligandrum]